MTNIDELRQLVDEPVEFGALVDHRDGRYLSVPIVSTETGLDELLVMRQSGRTEARQLDIDGRGNGNIHTLHILSGFGTLLVREHQREVNIMPNATVHRLPIETGGRTNVYPGTTYQIYADGALVVRLVCRDYDPDLELIHPLKQK